MRVRIHLNLAKPELAENAVRIQAPSGAWITVAYSTQLQLENCVPVVDEKAQRKVSQGDTRKIPHAFIEGDLVHFKGRLRDKAPAVLVKKARPFLVARPEFDEILEHVASLDEINYNPRFASCFYRDMPDKNQVCDRFLSSSSMTVVGWKFKAQSPSYAPLQAQDLCQPEALAKTSLSEKLGIRRGRETTERMLGMRAGTTP